MTIYLLELIKKFLSWRNRRIERRDERLVKKYGGCQWCGRPLLPISHNEGKCRKHIGVQPLNTFDENGDRIDNEKSK